MHHIAVHAGDGDDDDDDDDVVQCVLVNGDDDIEEDVLTPRITISVQDIIFKMINYGGDDVDNSLML